MLIFVIFLLEIEKIIGSNDIFLAKKLDSKSLNALFYEKKEDTIHYFLNKNLNRKLLSYFFGGRLFNYKKATFERMLFEPQEEKRFRLFPQTIEYYPLYQIVVQPILRHLVILSPIFNDIAQVIKLIQKYGFVLYLMRTISQEGLEKIISGDKNKGEEIRNFIAEENLYKFCFSFEEENKFKACIFFIIEAQQNLKFFEKKLLKRVILHNKEFYPPKSKLLFETSKVESVLLWQPFLQKTMITHHPNFTKCFNKIKFTY